jgi:hypothetical protein
MTSTLRLITACWILAACWGCSIKRIAVNKLGNALAPGGSTYESDDDPELVASAVPFGLKLMESLLANWQKQAEAVYPKMRGKLFPAELFDEARRLCEECRTLSNGGAK